MAGSHGHGQVPAQYIHAPGAACIIALVDRFAQHCHVVDIDADFGRQKHAVTREPRDPADPTRPRPRLSSAAPDEPARQLGRALWAPAALTPGRRCRSAWSRLRPLRAAGALSTSALSISGTDAAVKNAARSTDRQCGCDPRCVRP